MTALPKFSLSQQIEAVRFAETRQRALIGRNTSIKEMRSEAVARLEMQRLGAAARTLEWLGDHEGEIRKLLALDVERRVTLFQHMGTVVELLDQIEAQRVAELKAAAAAVPEAGGPIG